MRLIVIFFIVFFLLSNFIRAEESAFHSGGGTTNLVTNKNAFSLAAKNLPEYLKVDFLVGNSLFKRIWEDSRYASSQTKDGLGPFFNATSCESCHIRDGRGHLPDEKNEDKNSISVVIQIGQKNTTKELKYTSDKIYGSQISEFAITDILKEADIKFRYHYEPVIFNNGMFIELRKPVIILKNLNYGQIDKKTKFSARIAQPMIGLGLIENIDEKDILSNEDKFDLNRDGVSGKANYVWNIIHNENDLGRFGWKASQPTVYQQTAEAFFNDMGLSNILHKNPSNCSNEQSTCDQMLNINSEENDNLEVSIEQLNLITFYSQQLGVPARRSLNDKDVIEGKKIFNQLSCNACHVEKFTTGNNSEHENLNNQAIYPYSDFLLHDMGEGLSDELSEFSASGNEWRTAPLWGLGLTGVVSGRLSYLHDGRARTLIEAIAWHGGESEEIKKKFLNLNKTKLNRLLKFLESL